MSIFYYNHFMNLKRLKFLFKFVIKFLTKKQFILHFKKSDWKQNKLLLIKNKLIQKLSK